MMNPVGDVYVNRRCGIPYAARYSDFPTVLQIDMKPFPFASDGSGHSAVLSLEVLVFVLGM